MTRQILEYLALVRDAYLLQPGRVLEVGSLNVNGSPRDVFEALATEYVGCDMQAGRGVDRVMNNSDLLTTFGAASFDTVICCECLEHDSAFWDTVNQMQQIVKPGGYLVISTPSICFPYHAYSRHYVNFTKDAYEDWFFAEPLFERLNVRIMNSDAGEATTIAGIGKKR